MEEPGANSSQILEAWKEVEGFKLESKPTAKQIGPAKASIVSYKDFLIRSESCDRKSLKTYLEIQCGVSGEGVDWKGISAAMQDGRYKDLPSPFGPRTNFEVAYTLQLAIVPTTQGVAFLDATSFDIIKHYSFNETHATPLLKEKVKQEAGLMFEFQRIPDWLGMERVFQYLFERVGGMIYSYKLWPMEVQGKTKSMKPGARRAGWAFIRDKGPRSNNMKQFMEWADEWCNERDDSPIFGWCEGKVTHALGNYAKGRANAKPIDYCPITLLSFKPWFLNEVLRSMLGSLRQHALNWVGATRIGKSHGNKTVAYTASGVEIDLAVALGGIGDGELIPQILTAKHLDFFKSPPVEKLCPAILDDGNLAEQKADVVLAFCNPSEEDARLWARWGCSAFDVGASRQTCSNPHDKTLLLEAIKKARNGNIPYQDFVKVISPSFDKAAENEEHVNALLARSHFIVTGSDYVVLRPASFEQKPVRFIKYNENEKPDIFTTSAQKIIQQYNQNPAARVQIEI